MQAAGLVVDFQVRNVPTVAIATLEIFFGRCFIHAGRLKQRFSRFPQSIWGFDIQLKCIIVTSTNMNNLINFVTDELSNDHLHGAVYIIRHGNAIPCDKLGLSVIDFSVIRFFSISENRKAAR